MVCDVIGETGLEGDGIWVNLQMRLYEGNRSRLKVIFCTFGEGVVDSLAEGLYCSN